MAVLQAVDPAAALVDPAAVLVDPAAALVGPAAVQALLPEIRTAVHHLLVLQMDRMNSRVHFCWKARSE